MFGLERLEQHARSLAKAQSVGRVARASPSLPRRLKESYAVLGANFRLLAEAAKADKAITSAGEWFLDNFHIVDEQTRQAQRDLPSSFYRELPRLTDGPLRGYPRVAGIAWALLAHSDSAFDQEKLLRFLHAYQEVTPLTIGELWAVPITLRIALVENLRRLTGIVLARVADADRGDAAAAAILGSPPAAVADILGGAPSSAFLARLEQRLRNRGDRADAAAREIAQHVEARGGDVHAAIQDEYQAQAADDVSVRNVITTMRLVSDIDWADLFEDVSLVDRALSEAPGYRENDFATRDRYRRAIERMARACQGDEIALAAAAAAHARNQTQAGGDPRLCEVGYYLVGEGRHEFAREADCRLKLGMRLARALGATGLAGYAGSILFLALLIAILPALAETQEGAPVWILCLTAFLALQPASDVATALVNRAIARQRQPQCLPSLSLKAGVPDELRTMLVVPILLVSEEGIVEQIERMEVHYLANEDARMVYALLSDWTDSPTEHRDDDETLLAAAREGIAALNRRHADGKPPIFLLLHRRRQFNPAQNCWMGWERKRGKLHELNRLLRGATDTAFLEASGLPANVRYVITLDADTRMPRGAAKRLIGKMAHPLNRPRFDAARGRVVQGHAILQPRITPSLPVGSESSLFQYAFSSPNGLDPYAFAVSDVYQDLFDEGSFVGKGIYDVDMFERALDARIPENTVLSHDLLEGVFARSALVSDIELVEEFPSRYDVEAARQHRWMRGDWQLLPWILGLREGVPALGRWKLLDNLRRALGAPALLLAFLLGWCLPLPHAGRWTLFLLAVVAAPPLLPVVTSLFSPREWRLSAPGHARRLARESGLAALQSLFSLAFLARLAFLALDAMLRTLVRVAFSRKRLLEWVTFAQTAYRRDGRLRSLLFQLAGAFALVVAVALAMVLRAPGNLALSAPFLALWGFSPLIARWASYAPSPRSRREVRADDRRALRLAARRTWIYFEKFVTADDNWLPPDNFQETPQPLVARRTSPTNIGAYLCSVLAAHDFGWIGTVEALERLENSLAAMEKLHRYRGHFLNWYDTATLAPLEPAYVSTVDSGNLMGNLLAVKNAMAEIAPGGHNSAWRAGLKDAVLLLQADLARERPAPAGARQRLDALFRQLESPETGADILAEAGALAAQLSAAGALGACAQSHARDRDLDAQARARRAQAIAETCARLAAEMDFRFLFHERRQLLAIGYRVEDQSLDANAYDLLASEARLASFLAIAKGDIPTRHWFRLGRTLMPQGRGVALQSWSGSMFEYLMPTLLMHEPQGSLLALSNLAAVRGQIRYGAQRGVPWGISESQYNARDRNMNYQYSGFGVPGLGLKRGLAENLVIAPYATGLAAMIAPREARLNLERLAAIGGQGAYGWYEAVDYTRQRLPPGQDHAVVRAYMAHHQGMAILGIADLLHDGLMRARLHAEPMVKAVELLLQERMPLDAAFAKPPPTLKTGAITHHQEAPRGPRRFRDPHGALARTHLLANAHSSVMLTAAGGGYSMWNGLSISRWREDAVRDPWGTFIYLRDLRTGKVWSAAHNPVGAAADAYEAAFAEDRAIFKRTDGSLVTAMEICVSPEDDAEVRRISITNTGTRQRELEVTSYVELALARPQDDAAHPAFSKLFVETEYLADTGALLAGRRPRSSSDAPVWAAHLSVMEGEPGNDVQYETDRGRFLGRNRSSRRPQAIFESWPLSDTAGAVLDPVFSLRRRVQIPRGRTVTIAFWTLAASSRKAVLELVDRYHDASAFERTSRLATTTALTQLQYLGISAAEADLFQTLASHLIHAGEDFRPPPEVLAAAAPPARALWPHGISGDLPILLVRVGEEQDLALVRQLSRAHDYFRSKHLAVDVVILNEKAASYAQDLQHALDGLVGASDRPQDEKLGRILCIRADLAGAEACRMLRAAARVELEARRGELGQILSALSESQMPPPEKVAPAAVQPPLRPLPRPELEFFNAYGGFAAEGREYSMPHTPGRPTPAPWVNVVANPQLGFLVSAEGAGFTWSLNSQQNQLTPWSNDAVENAGGEAVYLRDLDDGAVWSPTLFPAAAPGAEYAAHHGQGYTRFEHARGGLSASLTQFVPQTDPVKIGLLRLRNDGPAPRNLAVTYYIEWRLGPSRPCLLPLLVDHDVSGALLARNPGHADFSARTAFMDLYSEGEGQATAFTADRTEFIGRNGALAEPAALYRNVPLSGRSGLMNQPCGVLQAVIRLAPGESRELVLLLGQGRDRHEATSLLARMRRADCRALLDAVTRSWDAVLDAVEVRTPDHALDLMVNRWLLYQALSCRMWARAGFYQVSGAYGFRDQLQDSMALCVALPELARAQLLRAAARQFPEGDTQHWWLPESGKGIRTRISDDRGWLAYVAAHYVETTGDAGVLEERLPFLTGPPLEEDQHDAFFQPGTTEETASLYEHCARALDASLATGAHGLPLMGTGDWNDGMNRIGERGKGESVWLGWFLHAALARFLPFAEARNDGERVARWMMQMDSLREALETQGWDGAWYRRAYFDDGFALGSASNRECRIDSIAQSWGVISGVAAPDRQRRAMEALWKYLVRPQDGLMALFAPPFVNAPHDPGYIKGYPAGIRENGGQYTHGALWAVAALARMGDGDRAGELFSMLNPVSHSRDRARAERYRVEPYVACADIYSVPPHVGRGGWTWYTGSAAWMYRVALENILGLRFAGDRLFLAPCIPSHWPGFEVIVRRKDGEYRIQVENPDGVAHGRLEISLDGVSMDAAAGIKLAPGTHLVRAVLRAGQQARPRAAVSR